MPSKSPQEHELEGADGSNPPRSSGEAGETRAPWGYIEPTRPPLFGQVMYCKYLPAGDNVRRALRRDDGRFIAGGLNYERSGRGCFTLCVELELDVQRDLGAGTTLF
jgi:hypothetical protein